MIPLQHTKNYNTIAYKFMSVQADANKNIQHTHKYIYIYTTYIYIYHTHTHIYIYIYIYHGSFGDVYIPQGWCLLLSPVKVPLFGCDFDRMHDVINLHPEIQIIIKNNNIRKKKFILLWETMV